MPTTATTTTTDYETSDAILAAPAVNAAHAAVDDHDPEDEAPDGFSGELLTAAGPCPDAAPLLYGGTEPRTSPDFAALRGLWKAVDARLEAYQITAAFTDDLIEHERSLGELSEAFRAWGDGIRALPEGQGIVVDGGEYVYFRAPWLPRTGMALSQVMCIKLIAGDRVAIRGVPSAD